MKVLYLSNLYPRCIENEILKKAILSPAATHFNRMIVNGLNQNGCKITCINHNSSQKLNDLVEDGVVFKTLTPKAKYISTQISYFFQVIKIFKEWNTADSNSERFVICDSIDSYLSFPLILCARIYKVKNISIVTDFLYYEHANSIIKIIALALFKLILKISNKFVFLTEEMNEVVKCQESDYTVIEGMTEIRNECVEKTKRNNTCIYSGSIADIYEIYKLIDAFKYLEDLDLKLEIYTMDEETELFKKSIANVNNVKNCGYRNREEIVEIQKKAFLLANPRSCKHQLTRYSFPSKILEYLSSGTPVITTKLPGIPKEYNDYLLYFDNNDPQVMADNIRDIYNKAKSEIELIGSKGKKFVATKKNNVVQTKKILNLIEGRE